MSLTESDLATLDEFTRTAGWPGRSAVVHAAVRGLWLSGLGDDYRSLAGVGRLRGPGELGRHRRGRTE